MGDGTDLFPRPRSWRRRAGQLSVHVAVG